tara:strand:- start:152 stop:502 length:351 start_codon:yes stop_codon:yes gene_type:complete
LIYWITNRPISGIDMRYCGYCSNCNEHVSIVTRGKIAHCRSCGHEFEMPKFSDEDKKDLIRSSASFWKRGAKLPYDWYKRSESERFAMLEGRRGLLDDTCERVKKWYRTIFVRWSF